MLLNNTNILNCGVAHKGRDRNEAEFKQHASKPGVQILPEKTVEASLLSPERKKAAYVLIEFCPCEGGLPNSNTDVYLNTIHHYLPSISQRETLFL
jgi:hypothetical protein